MMQDLFQEPLPVIERLQHDVTRSRHVGVPIDISPFEWNFDLDMPGQKFHHSLKEHHKISNIPKFRCEML
jgi:hypothetical protein